MTQILLIGDSLVADYDWQKRMPSCTIHNLGVPGIMSSGVLSSLPNIREQVSYADIAMVMVGTNDLLTGNYEFTLTLKEILVQINHLYPAAEVLVNGIFPMELPHLPYNSIESLNIHIEAIAMRTGCCFLDTHNRFVQHKEEIFQLDGVHITDKAYDIWSRTLLEHIAFLIEDD